MFGHPAQLVECELLVGNAVPGVVASVLVLDVARGVHPFEAGARRIGADAFAHGAAAQGADVVAAGLGSSDMAYYASGSLGLPGAMITASHNPAKYNGIKLCRAGAAPIGEQTGLQQIKEMVASGVTARGDSAGKVEHLDLLDAFGAHVRSFVDLSVLRPLRVVADTANGMGGLVVPVVFGGLPFDLEVMYGELDGTFPNHPADPINPANQEDLKRRVVEAAGEQADRAAGRGGEAEDADRSRLLAALGEHGHDHAQDHRRGERAADALDQPGADQQPLAAGHAAEQRGGREDRQGDRRHRDEQAIPVVGHRERDHEHAGHDQDREHKCTCHAAHSNAIVRLRCKLRLVT